MVHTGEEWCNFFGHIILDHDGWRYDNKNFFTSLISFEEYKRRYYMCTVDLRRGSKI